MHVIPLLEPGRDQARTMNNAEGRRALPLDVPAKHDHIVDRASERFGCQTTPKELPRL